MVNEDRLDRMRLRGEQRFLALFETHGGTLSATEAARLLGVPTKLLDELRERIPLFAFQRDSEWRYPAAQFEQDSVLPGITEVAQALRHLDPGSRVQFLFRTLQFGNENGRLGEEQTVIELIRQGRLKPVLFEAKMAGNQVST